MTQGDELPEMLNEEEPAHFLAPDIGAIFEYEGSRYRLDGWLKERDPPTIDKNQSAMDQMIQDILYQAQQEIGPKRLKLRWCLRKDATHVAGSGVCGCVAPIEDIKVIGRVNWSPELLKDARAQADHLAARGVDIF